MPKSAKHKAQRAADFQKTKLKLGSGKGKKTTAKTATDTSFKARTIALPQQSITADKSQAIVTRRNLTLDDLLAQTRHYNGSIRKDALFGLRELLSVHPFLLQKPGILPSVLAASLRLIPDEDPSVRKAVHTFLSFLLPALAESSAAADDEKQQQQQHRLRRAPTALVHYAPSLILYTVSALSHIFTEVRIDALRILDLLLDILPGAVVGDWDGFALAARAGGGHADSGPAPQSASTRRGAESSGQQVITCLLTILGISDLATFAQQHAHPQRSTSVLSGVSTATANLPASARLLLFQIIGKFLAASDAQTDSGTDSAPQQDLRCPTWFMRSAFESPADCEAFERFLRSPAAPTQQPADDEHDADAHVDNWIVSSAQYGQDGDSTLGGNGGSLSWGAMDLHAAMVSSADALHAQDDDDMFDTEDAPKGASDGKAVRRGPAASSPSRFSTLASALAPVFLNSLLDSLPSLFTPDSILGGPTGLPLTARADPNAGLDLHGQLVHAIIQATLRLWRSLASSLAKASAAASLRGARSKALAPGQLSELRTFIAKLAPYFPFGEHIPGAASRTPRETEQITEMDLMYAELVALCIFCSDSIGDEQGARAAAGKGKRKATAQEVVLHQLEDVGEYIVESLLGQRQAGAGASAGAGTLGVLAVQMAPATFAELLPTIWLLLNLKDVPKQRDDDEDSDDDDSERGGEDAPDLRTRLVDAIVQYFGKTNRGKLLIFEFIARLTVLHTFPSYSARFVPVENPAILTIFRQWFSTLPRVLWDAGTKKDSVLADAILEYLRSVCAADDGEILSHEDIDALHAPLAVFFHLQHPTRGPLAGPYARLPAEAQSRARALLFYLRPLDTKLHTAVTQAGAISVSN